jgi:uncharacterized Zn-binding protein involved in type VI secretion
MPPVTRLGDICTGHGCWPPRGNDQASPDVYANDIAVHRKTDHWPVHCCGPACHDSNLEAGSPTVFANFLDVCRIGDPVICGSVVAEGSPNVFAGEDVGSAPVQPEAAAPPPDSAPKRLVVPPVVISPAAQAKIDKKTNDYVAAPEKYKQNSAVTNDQVKGNYAGTPEQPRSSGESLIDPTPPAGDIPTFLRSVLDEAAKGQWSETGMGGNPSNPKILNVWKELGFGNNGAWGSDQTAWCMGFVNYVLKNTGYRFVQTARARDIRDRASEYKAQQVPLDQGQPGDICLWSYSHVNFIYTGSAGKYTFVGGNQSDKAKNANNPSGGSATQSWPSGYSTPGNGSLVSIWRPVKK